MINENIKKDLELIENTEINKKRHILINSFNIFICGTFIFFIVSLIVLFYLNIKKAEELKTKMLIHNKTSKVVLAEEIKNIKNDIDFFKDKLEKFENRLLVIENKIAKEKEKEKKIIQPAQIEEVKPIINNQKTTTTLKEEIVENIDLPNYYIQLLSSVNMDFDFYEQKLKENNIKYTIKKDNQFYKLMIGPFKGYSVALREKITIDKLFKDKKDSFITK